MKIVFDETDHSYWNDTTGEEVPGVSRIMKTAGLMPAFYKTLSPRYAEIGKHTHTVCQYDDEGSLEESSVDPVIMPKLMAYRNFKKQLNVQVLSNEELVYHGDLGYAGTFDKIVKLNGDTYLLDLKGESPVAYHRVQTIAYKSAFSYQWKSNTGSEPPSMKRAALYLRKDGKFLFRPHDDERGDEEAWRLAVAKFWEKVNAGDIILKKREAKP